MKQGWNYFRIAWSFLTIFPSGTETSLEPSRLARSMAFFPVVGLALGLGLVAVNALLEPFIPRAVLDCLLLLILIAVTGGLHLDGIADLIDGLAGSRDPQGALRIMKDSRVGAMGVVGLVMVLLLKYLSLYHVPLSVKSAALIFMPAAGRWIQVLLAASCSYARSEGGTASAFVDNVSEREFLIASFTLLAAAVVLFSFKGVLIAFLLLLAALGLVRYFERRLGGVTGDVLGAGAEVTEILVLLLILVVY